MIQKGVKYKNKCLVIRTNEPWRPLERLETGAPLYAAYLSFSRWNLQLISWLIIAVFNFSQFKFWLFQWLLKNTTQISFAKYLFCFFKNSYFSAHIITSLSRSLLFYYKKQNKKKLNCFSFLGFLAIFFFPSRTEFSALALEEKQMPFKKKKEVKEKPTAQCRKKLARVITTTSKQLHVRSLNNIVFGRNEKVNSISSKRSPRSWINKQKLKYNVFCAVGAFLFFVCVSRNKLFSLCLTTFSAPSLLA